MNKPNSTIVLISGETPLEIFCSFALLNEVIKIVGGISGVDNLPNALLDPILQEKILKCLLSKRTKTGRVTEKLEDLGDIDLSVEEIGLLLDWISAHIVDFTLGALEKAQLLQQRHLERFKKLTPA